MSRFLPTLAGLASIGVALAGLAVPAQATAVPSIASTPHTVRTADGAFDVHIGGAKRTSVTVSDPAYSVRTSVNADATRAALVVDFDGHHGTRLDVLDVASGAVTTAATGKITSAAFAADGRLAYVDGTTVHAPGATATVPGAAAGTVELLGWTGDAVLVQHRPDHTAPLTLSRVDVATGKATEVLRSDQRMGVVWRDFRLTTVAGRPRVSAIRATHVYPCAGVDSTLVLATVDGTVLRQVGRTTDSYRGAVWSADGASVAYELQGCVSQQQKATDGAGALARLDKLNGIHLRDVASGATRQVVRGLTQNFRLTGLSGGSVEVSSDRFGVRSLPVLGTATASTLDEGTDPGTQARIFPSTFIHQLWDTADDFNGNSACGPTSTVMDLAGYQLASHRRVWASSPYGHWSNFGGYISQQYSAYGYTYNRWGPDPNWNRFAGAYGWMVTDPGIGSWHSEIYSYLDQHVSYAIATASNPSAAWIRARIDANTMVVVSGNFAYGRYGHIGLITGYTDDGRFYVNDPYGAGTDGSYDGKNTVYTLDYMRGWAFWAA